jgi:mutator protein MutT
MKRRIRKTLEKTMFNLVKFKPVTVGVPVIIQNSKKEILLGKRKPNSLLYPDVWGLPGGALEYGEELKECAKREIKEELGVGIKIIKKSSNVYENLPNKKVKFHSVDIVFYAKIISGKPIPKDETSEIKWFKPSEIKKMNLAYSHKNILEKEGLLK